MFAGVSVDVLEIRNRPISGEKQQQQQQPIETKEAISTKGIDSTSTNLGTDFEIKLSTVIFRIELIFPDILDLLDKKTNIDSHHAYKGWNVNDIPNAGHSVDATTSSIDSAPLIAQFVSRHSVHGISVYSLLSLGLIPFYKRKLLKLYVDLPIWSLHPLEMDRVIPRTLYLRYHSMTGIESLSSTLGLWYHKEFDMQLDKKWIMKPSMLLALGSSRGSILGVAIDEVGGTSTTGNDIDVERRVSKVLWSSLQAELTSHSGDLAGGL